MKLKFTKMHGAGNDFIVIDSTKETFSMTPEQLRFIADRHFGIGADQILIVEAPRSPENDFRYRIFNQDGGEVEMCGNGARCFARFVHDLGLTAKKRIRVETMKGVIQPELQDDGRVKVDMGAPRFRPEEIPLATEGLSHLSRGVDTLWEVKAAGYNNWVSVVSMGNPHAVMVVGDVDTAPVGTVGPAIEHSPAFPERVNVGFLQPVSRTEGRLRVWERGAGETLACGTGACAAAVAGMRRGLFDPAVELSMHGGRLRIEWDGTETGSVFLIGPAATVFTGEIEVPEI